MAQYINRCVCVWKHSKLKTIVDRNQLPTGTTHVLRVLTRKHAW